MKSTGSITNISEEIARDFQGLLPEVMDDMLGDADTRLLQLIRNNYENIPPAELELIRTALGHTDGEVTPCRVCEIIAREEMRLSEE